MKCKWCGYNNPDNSIYCENCKKIVQEQKFYEILNDMRQNGAHNQPQQANGYNYYQNADKLDFQDKFQKNAVYSEPKKKINFKVVGLIVFVFCLITFFVFSTVIFVNTKMEETKKQDILNNIPLEQDDLPENQTQEDEQGDVSIDINSYDSSIPKDIESMEELPIEQTQVENIDIPIENKNIEIENEIFPDNTGVSFYGLVNLKIPANYTTCNPILYNQTTYSFWDTSTMTMFNSGYENMDELRHIYETWVLPYKDVWNFPEKKDELNPISFNGYFAYFVDGYNQDLDLYSRTFFITNIESIVNENGIATPMIELDKAGEYIVLSFTYKQENANKMSKFMEYTCMNGKTKFHQNGE